VLTYVRQQFCVGQPSKFQYNPRNSANSPSFAVRCRASAGLSWYNAHPAEVFRASGSLALGGTLGTIAVIIKQEVLLLFVGGIFVDRALSVILQVGSFKLRGNDFLHGAHPPPF